MKPKPIRAWAVYRKDWKGTPVPLLFWSRRAAREANYVNGHIARVEIRPIKSRGVSQ